MEQLSRLHIAILNELRQRPADTWTSARHIGATITGAGVPSSSASQIARRALDRLCTHKLVEKDTTKLVVVYRITNAGSRACTMPDISQQKDPHGPLDTSTPRPLTDPPHTTRTEVLSGSTQVDAIAFTMVTATY